MEKIKINDIQIKGREKTICVVKYFPIVGAQVLHGITELEATLNTKWQSQEVDFLQKDVGIGGEVSVVIEQKGQYTNITKVDFSSAVKGELNNVGQINQAMEQVMGKPTNDPKHDSIVAQVILKGAVELACNVGQGVTCDNLGETLCLGVNELTGAYRLALSNVKAL